MHPTKEQITHRFTDLQNQICQGLVILNNNTSFAEELWERQGGGGGRTRITQNGTVIEKGGVNFSAVYGVIPPKIAQALQLPPDEEFYATGVSIVLHPYSPLMPIIHMNVRYFEISNGQYWFGGGIDLTPHYVVPADARYFHQQLQAVCQPYQPHYYPQFKKWADEYFYLKHRQETRGIGGIFFDRLTETEQLTKNQIFAFVQDVGELFVPIYTYFVNKYAHLPFTPQQQEWQFLRRSRYVEFNLIYDKGTKFGLDTDGRTESILMSMPPLAKWAYNYHPPAGTPEAQTLAWLKQGINWVEQQT